MYEVDLKTEKPAPGRYLANDADLVSYLKNRGVLKPANHEAARERMRWHAEKGHWSTWPLDELVDDVLAALAAGIGDTDE